MCNSMKVNISKSDMKMSHLHTIYIHYTNHSGALTQFSVIGMLALFSIHAQEHPVHPDIKGLFSIYADHDS